MVQRSVLQKVLEDWEHWYDRVKRKLIPRSAQIRLPRKNALGIVGVRRGGKSFTAVQISREFSGVLYMNFEDPAFLFDSGVENLDELVSVFVEEKRAEPSFVVLDEIQNIKGWEKWVRKAVELEQFHTIVTGSSSKMLSQELATALAGRVIEKHVWPLSFSEYLEFASRKPKTRNEFISELRFFLKWGAFPEIVLLESEDEKKEQLEQYLSDIVLKDVIQRRGIRSTRTLDIILNFYFTHISSLHSYTSLKKAFGIGIDTATQYTRFFNEAFLIFEVSRFHPSLKAQARDPKKVYAIDTGLRNVFSSTRDHDYGKLAENAVYIHLRRHGLQPYYFKEKGEVDFLITRGLRPNKAIQVTFSDLKDPAIYEREVQGLIECLRMVKLKEGLILTLSRKESQTIDGFKVAFLPLYEWLLSTLDDSSTLLK